MMRSVNLFRSQQDLHYIPLSTLNWNLLLHKMLRVVKSASLGEDAHLTVRASQLTPSQAVDNVCGLGEKIAIVGGNKVG